MGTSGSISLCRGPAAVKVLHRSTRVEPEQPTPHQDTQAVFGVSLQHLRDAGCLQHGVPVVLKNMVEFLEKYGLQQSGVFRVCGSAPRCRTLRVCLDRGERVDLEEADVSTVAALLKQYLRELPSGLVPHTHSKRMQQALTDSKDETQLLEALKESLHRLPDDNYNILSYLLRFLSQVAAHSQWNHMTSENLATVFGPCVFRVPEGLKMLEEQTMCNTLMLRLLEKHTHLITHTNTHTSYTAPTRSHGSIQTHTTHSRKPMLSPPGVADLSKLQQEQTCTSEKVCSVNVGVAKDTGALPSVIADTHPLSKSQTPTSSTSTTQCVNHLRHSNVSKPGTVDTDDRRGRVKRRTEAETKETAGHSEGQAQPESCLNKDQFCATYSHMSLTSERPTPEGRSSTDVTRSDTRHETHRKIRHMLPETRDTHSHKDSHMSNTSRKRSLSGDTQTESRGSHSEPGSKHTPSSSNTSTEARISQSFPHVHTDYSCTHTHSPDTRATEEDVSSVSSLYVTAPPSSSVHRQITTQAQTLSRRQDSASCATSSQSHAIRENGADCSHEASTSQLRQRIRKLKRAVRSFEEPSHNIHNYKADVSSKTAHPDVVKLMNDLSRAEGTRRCVNAPEKSEAQKLSVRPHKPGVEETVKTVTQRLREKRLELNLPEHLQDMTHAQLALEKTTLQKCLLYYESLHGRPSCKEERSVIKELYDRYHLVKQAFYSTNMQADNTRGSEEIIHVNHVPEEEDVHPVFITQTVTQATEFISETCVVNSVRRVELLRQLKQTRMEKRQLKIVLKEFENNFLIKTGRSVQREDRLIMADDYSRYRALKDKLRLLKGMPGKKTHNLKADRDRIAI